MFATTRWTIIRDAAHGGDTLAVEALGSLVRTYWQPLYRYARRKGKAPEDAEDLVQGFLAHVIAARTLRRTDPSKGRFRAFLLASFRNWMINDWKRGTREKRGGGAVPLSLDWQSAETGLRLEPADDQSPDKRYDREWALALLDKVLADLESTCRAEGGAAQFEALKPCLMRQALASRTVARDGDKAPPLPPPSPEEIADKFPGYEILECLGRGAMGAVYKALQKSLNRLVAIKILAPERIGEGRFAERFTIEAELLAKLGHPHIVTIHDFGETGGLFYLVMEFIDGVNLRDLLREGKVEPEQALAIVSPICDALEYAHQKGVVHRDIKPENILLDRDGRVKIADFGIASLVGATGEKSGTPPYMAPEQKEGVVDRRADIYALGVVLYEMLTGERPDKDLVAPSKRVEVDVKIDEMVLRALEKEPERRYQTAEEFRTAVRTLATKTPTEEPTSSREVRAPPAATTPVQAARFSRTAIVGACWAPLFFFAIAPMYFAFSAAGQSQGPAKWQHVLMFTLLPLGLTAPFGTTILGGVALTQIRRSAGKLYGLGLALFDGLLFPLLAFDALIGGFWLLLVKVLPSSSGSDFELTPVHLFLATLVTVIISNVLIVRWAWRAANKPVDRGDSFDP